MRDTKIKGTPLCSPHQAGSKHVLLDLGQFENLTSGQVRSGQGQSMTQICQYTHYTSSEAAQRAKSFGTICASLSPSCRDLLVEKRIVTFDLR